MQFVGGTTPHAPPLISRPNFELYVCRDNATSLKRSLFRFFSHRLVRNPFDSDELKLKNISHPIVLNPRIDQMEKAIVGPNTSLDFFIYLNDIRTLFHFLKKLGSPMKFSIFS